MFTIKLLENTNSKVIYEIWNSDTDEKINEITVNKKTYDYQLEHGKEVSNSYEAGSYRAILKFLQKREYPRNFSNGWC